MVDHSTVSFADWPREGEDWPPALHHILTPIFSSVSLTQAAWSCVHDLVPLQVAVLGLLGRNTGENIPPTPNGTACIPDPVLEMGQARKTTYPRVG